VFADSSCAILWPLAADANALCNAITGAYVIRPTARHYYSSGPLSSTLAHTPWVLDAVMRNPPRREIAADVLASMTKVQ
jgi:hypothetical protein